MNAVKDPDTFVRRMPMMPLNNLVLETELSIEECLARLTAEGAPRRPAFIGPFRRPYPGTLLYHIRGNAISLQLADSLIVGEGFTPELRGAMESSGTGTRIHARIGLPRRTLVGAGMVWATWTLGAVYAAWRSSISLLAILGCVLFLLFGGACLVGWLKLLGSTRSGDAPNS